MVSHLRSLLDLNPAQTCRVIDVAIQMKASPKEYRDALRDLNFAMIFSKQSTRTRISFEVGLQQLGAHALFLTAGGATGMQMGRGETIEDTARVLSRFVDGIIIRTFSQAEVEELATHGSVPVVNALTDLYHPCQALADLQTITERFGSARGKKVVYVGAGNNVAHSLMLAGPRAGFDIVVACPEPLPPDPEVLARAAQEANDAGTRVLVSHDLDAAVEGAHVLYTDTWVSMGEEKESMRLIETLAGWTVDDRLFEMADPEAIFMHCLPAHRGEEVSVEVMDGPRSVVFDQAENRLHAQKALLALLFGAVPWDR